MYISLHTNILAKLAELLPDHSELPFAIEIDRNKLGKSTKGYAVILDSSKASDSEVVGRVSLTTTIQVRLSDIYSHEKTGDSLQQSASNTLADRCIAVYKALAAAKLNTSGVRNVSLSDISEPSYIDGEKTVYRTLTIEANIRA